MEQEKKEYRGFGLEIIAIEPGDVVCLSCATLTLICTLEGGCNDYPTWDEHPCP